jgi:hypothetical protein
MCVSRLPALRVLVFALPLLFASTSLANADFLDDLFGDDQRVAAPPPSRERSIRMRSRPRGDFSIRLNEGHRAAKASSQRFRGHSAGTGHTRTIEGNSKPDEKYSAGSRPQKAALCFTASEAQPALANSTAYLHDETLRAGDGVVTEGAIVIFRGRGACPHSPADFVPVAHALLPRSTKNALVLLQQGMRSPHHVFNVHAFRAAPPRGPGQRTN